jgi:hypothetical protein
MTAADRFDRRFADMLADVAQPAYPDYIDDVLTRATAGSQRPAWTFPERWLPMGTIARPASLAPGLPWRNLGVLAVLALLAAAILAVALGTQQRLAPPYGPARNGTIVYQVDGDIRARDVIDGAERVLIGGEGFDVFPIFSRDGSTLAFLRIDPETRGTPAEAVTVYVANPDGTAARAVFGPTILRDLAWSPAGDELAVLDEVDGTSRLSIVAIDDGAARVVEFNGSIIGRVQWRPPDGRELVVLAEVDGLRSFYVAASDGTGQRSVTGGRHIPTTTNVALTPDGKSLVYMHMELPFGIRVLDLESGDVRVFGRSLPPLGPGTVHAGGVQVSADGKTLVFGRYWDEDFEAGVINHQIWAASLENDGADGVAVSPPSRSQAGVDPNLVLTSPDSGQIVVHRLETTDTWITDFPGGEMRMVDWGSFFETDWQRLAP